MNLILWRHAEVEDMAASLRIQHNTDLQREFTKRGHKQTEKMANWLRSRLPANALVLASPVVRTQQTAHVLTEHFQTLPVLAPDADVSVILDVLGWPSNTNLLLIGHQPQLGHLTSLLTAGMKMDQNVKKAGVRWLCHHIRGDGAQIVLCAVVNPDLA